LPSQKSAHCPLSFRAVAVEADRFGERLWRLRWIIFPIFLYLSGGLFFRQIIQHKKFTELGLRQSHRRLLQPAPRGNIYDRNGNLLAGNRPRFVLAIYLQELREEFADLYRSRVRALREEGRSFVPEEERSLARVAVVERYLDSVRPLAAIAPVDRTALDRHFRQRPLLPFTLADDLSWDVFAALVEKLPPDGRLQLLTRSSRVYPNGPCGAHVLGYAAPAPVPPDDCQYRTFSERTLVGRAGIEAAMDRLLRGKDGDEVLLVDPSGQREKVLHFSPLEPGKDLYLSLDLDLQRAAEDALGEEIGCAILSDVWTGEVLAMANSPSYDPNVLTPSISQKTYGQLTERGVWANQAIQGLYPPGSVFKLVSVEALLRFGVVNRSTVHPCEGTTRVGNRIIRCSNHLERGPLPFSLAVAKSCNSFVIDNIFSIPLEKFLEEIERLGFGALTGIELPHETGRSLVPSPRWKRSRGHGRWTDGDTANLAIGQGYLLATPMQVNALTASLATRRERTRPTVLRRDSLILSLSPLGLSEESYGALLEGMVGCVNYGSGRRCRLEGISVAGKTGTAQVRDGLHNSHLAWFTAFAPAERPQVAVTVMVREAYEGRSYGGGSDAAPVARKILKKYFEKFPPQDRLSTTVPLAAEHLGGR
jgi:penicillin-binding protein 2